MTNTTSTTSSTERHSNGMLLCYAQPLLTGPGTIPLPALIYPSAWKAHSQEFISDILYHAVAVGEKRAYGCRESRASTQHLGRVQKDSPCRIAQKLTPLLTPPRAQHAAIARNREQRNGLR